MTEDTAMPAMFHVHTLLASVLLATIFLAVIHSDLQCRRIPNHLILKGLALAWGIHGHAAWQSLPALSGHTWWAPAGGMLVGAAALMPLYLARACGAGDLKLMAMVGAFVGPTTVLHAALYTLLAGGVLSLVWMLVQGVAVQTLQNVHVIVTDLIFRVRTGRSARLNPLTTTAARLPYAVAIAVGTCTALLQQHGAT
jgi:prepilin peptidase CpaA